MLVNRLGQRLLPWRRSDHYHSNDWFDRNTASWLASRDASVFVGCETCALHSMKKARDLGMRVVLDCPGIPADFLDEQAALAGQELGLPDAASTISPRMKERKAEEMGLPDIILTCSEFQRRALVSRGAREAITRVASLWTDVDFWSAAPPRTPREPGAPLRVLYVGTLSLRKGLPYLLQASAALGKSVKLTVVGSASPEMNQLLARHSGMEILPRVTKQELRNIYARHDVFVMPSLGDSFGFVILEAMASGLPVIASENAGAPVPDESWRVPARNANAIAERLDRYVSDPGLVEEHGRQAIAFARQFRPERYRAQVAAEFASLLVA